MHQSSAGPIAGGIFLGVIALYAAFLLTRLYLRRRDRERRLNDPELAQRAMEGKTLAASSEKSPPEAVDHEGEADEAATTIPLKEVQGESSKSPESPLASAAPSTVHAKNNDEAIQ